MKLFPFCCLGLSCRKRGCHVKRNPIDFEMSERDTFYALLLMFESGLKSGWEIEEPLMTETSKSERPTGLLAVSDPVLWEHGIAAA